MLVSGEQAAAQSDRVQSVLREPGRPSADVMRAPALLNVPSSPTAHSLSHLPGPDTHQRMDPGTMGVNSLPKTVTRQRSGCDLKQATLRLSPAR